MKIRPVFHPFAIIYGAIIILLVSAAFILGMLLPSVSIFFYTIGAVLSLGIIFRFLNLAYVCASMEYVVNEGEITQITGIFAKDESHVPIDKIQDYKVNRSLFGRLIGVADIGVQTARAERGFEITLNSVREEDAVKITQFLDEQVRKK